MRRAIATVSMSGTLRQKLEAISAAGFDAIELFENDFIHSAAPARELASMCADLGLAIDLYQPFRDFEGMPEALFTKSLERAERKFDVMEALGAPLLLVCSNTSPESLGDGELAASQLHTLAERAARRGLRIGYEALAWGRHVKRYGEAWRIVARADHPHLGLILDSFHTLSLADDPTGIATIPGNRIFFVQMADAPVLAMDVLQWARHFRNFPGQGQLDVTTFFEQVLRSGYRGTLSLEIFNDVFRETPNRRTAVDAMRSLLWLEDEGRQRLAQGDLRDEPRRRDALGIDAQVPASEPIRSPATLAYLPAPTTLGGFAFIEFGVDDDASVGLGRLLEQLGFSRVGRHRSKQVTLYRQGDIHLIVNAEPNSDARERFDEQGVCVSAVGVFSDDAERAVSRATALLSARFDSPLGTGESRLPAFRSPGGMLLHFVPPATGSKSFVESDFTSEGEGDGDAQSRAASESHAPSDVGLRRIDHIAMGLGPDQLDSWILFSRSVLALDVGESLELADPFGLVRTCSVATADRRVRIVLNVSRSQRTRTARVVAALGGKPAVHHIAFDCTDIFATVAALRARGVGFVTISDNYYDDLLARFALAPAFVERLRKHGVLYDRSTDDAGNAAEYFHIYGESFADRFFFEIVQRANYDGYGAANAPARMASEAQASERR